MSAPMRFAAFASVLATVLLAACGGGGGSGTQSGSGGGTSGGTAAPMASNVTTLSVDLGPENDYANGLFTSVTVCVPGSTTNCQIVDHVLVDTGSYGLRLLGSAVSSSLALPAEASGSGSTGECTVFADGFTWGPVVLADIHLGDEVASSVPVNVVGASNFPAAPTGCSNGNGSEEDTAAALGTNGILGVGPFQYDCGTDCATRANGAYWSCSASSCTEVEEPESGQVQNPVPLFATDNNGVIIQLPSVPPGGQATATGSMIFGIGTESNNALGTATVIATDDLGEFTTKFNGSNFPSSFIDSGSNALIFEDSGIATCTGNADGFFCPPSTEDLSGTMVSNSGTTAVVPFTIANANSLFSTDDAAFDDLGAPSGSTLAGSFDWGLPFFYGRSVYVALQGHSTSGGVGPYFAF